MSKWQRLSSEEIVDLLLQIEDPALLREVASKLDKRISENKICVEYAGELSETEKHRLRKHLLKKFKQAVGVEYRRTDDLIGGIRINYKDYVYEDTVRARLKGLGTLLLKE